MSLFQYRKFEQKGPLNLSDYIKDFILINFAFEVSCCCVTYCSVW